MSNEHTEKTLELYHEIYTNLQTEADPKIIETLNELIKTYPDATYTQLISSLKIYLLSIIELMLKQHQPTDDNQGEKSESSS